MDICPPVAADDEPLEMPEPPDHPPSCRPPRCRMTIKIDPKPLRMLTTSMVARNRPGVYSLRDFCVSFETS